MEGTTPVKKAFPFKTTTEKVTSSGLFEADRDMVPRSEQTRSGNSDEAEGGLPQTSESKTEAKQNNSSPAGEQITSHSGGGYCPSLPDHHHSELLTPEPPQRLVGELR